MKKLTDEEKVNLWEEVCIEANLATTAEIKFWVEEAGIFFTSSGSAVPTDIYLLTLSSLKKMLPDVDAEQLVTFVLEYITGVLQFQNVETEKYFWNMIEQLLSSYDVEIPEDIKPSFLNYERED